MVVAALLLLPASAAADERVDSGPLAARVASDPWQLTLDGFSGEDRLVEDGERGVGPLGALGFSTPVGRYHATRVTEVARRSDGAARLTVATNDPLGRTLDVTIAPAGEGVLRLTAAVLGAPGATATSIGFGTGAEERFLGFGERSNAVDQRGNEVENYVSDGPYQEYERPIISAIVPPDGFRPRDDATYFPVPWLLSTRGYGVLVGNDDRSVFRLGVDRADGWSVEVDSTQLDLRFIAGPEPADVLRRFTGITGRQPDPAAPWFFGPWYQPHGDDPELKQAADLRDADVPASAVSTYLHYLPCGDQQGVEAEQPPRTAGLHGEGYAVTTYFNPMVCASYGAAFNPAAERGLLTKTPAGTPALYRYSANTDDAFIVGQFDFSNPATDDYYGELLGEAIADGYDGWMEDFGEYSPLNGVSFDGTPGPAMHNRYPVLYHRSGYRFAKKQKRAVAGFIRSGWTGVAPYAQLVWGGDPTVSFGFDGLSSSVKQALSLGTSGISRWGSDIGGFFALGRRLTPELLIRWIQFGAASPVMRTQANGVAVPPQSDRPQITDPGVLPIWRRYTKLHTQLYPYLLAADAEYRRSGMPTMRHLALAYPGDTRAAALEDEYLFGPDLLAAPVVSDGARERSVYLPKGRWINFWDAISYGEEGGTFRPSARPAVMPGARDVSVDAPLDRLPLMIRAGALLPMLPADVDTLADPEGEGVVGLSDRRRRLDVIAFPRGRSQSRFYEDGRLVSRAREGSWRLAVKGRTPTRRFTVRASLGSLKKPFVPRTIRLGEDRLPRRAWSYERKTTVLTVRARLLRGPLRVSGRR